MSSLPSSSEIRLEDISQIESFEFEDVDEMEEIIRGREDELDKDETGDEYIAFWGVMPATFRSLPLSIWRAGRRSYHLPTRTMIIRVGSYLLHEMTKEKFTYRITRELDRMGFPMLYAEVGTTNGIVLTCVLNRNHQAPKMVVRKYELAENNSSSRAFVRKAICTGMIELTRSNGTTQIIGKDLVANTTTSILSDTNLTLSVEKVIGHQPASCSERNVIITGVTLQQICEHMWERQGHM